MREVSRAMIASLQVTMDALYHTLLWAHTYILGF